MALMALVALAPPRYRLALTRPNMSPVFPSHQLSGDLLDKTEWIVPHAGAFVSKMKQKMRKKHGGVTVEEAPKETLLGVVGCASGRAKASAAGDEEVRRGGNEEGCGEGRVADELAGGPPLEQDDMMEETHKETGTGHEPGEALARRSTPVRLAIKSFACLACTHNSWRQPAYGLAHSLVTPACLNIARPVRLRTTLTLLSAGTRIVVHRVQGRA